MENNQELLKCATQIVIQLISCTQISTVNQLKLLKDGTNDCVHTVSCITELKCQSTQMDIIK